MRTTAVKIRFIQRYPKVSFSLLWHLAETSYTAIRRIDLAYAGLGSLILNARSFNDAQLRQAQK